jgi:hypothetical protein
VRGGGGGGATDSTLLPTPAPAILPGPRSPHACSRRVCAPVCAEQLPVDTLGRAVGEPVRGGPFPILHVTWDQQRIPITATDLHDCLLHGTPSIQTHAKGRGNTFYLRPVALRPDDHRIVATRLHEVLHNASRSPHAGRHPGAGATTAAAATTAPPAFDVGGSWMVTIFYTVGPPTQHRFALTQHRDGVLSGVHAGRLSEAPASGSLRGRVFALSSELPVSAITIAPAHTLSHRPTPCGRWRSGAQQIDRVSAGVARDDATNPAAVGSVCMVIARRALVGRFLTSSQELWHHHLPNTRRSA